MEFYPLDKGIHLFQIEFKVDLHWGFTKPSSMSSIQPRALCRRRGPSVISLWRCPTLAELRHHSSHPIRGRDKNLGASVDRFCHFILCCDTTRNSSKNFKPNIFRGFCLHLDCYRRRLSARGHQPPEELCHRRSQERPQGGHLHPILAYQLKL